MLPYFRSMEAFFNLSPSNKTSTKAVQASTCLIKKYTRQMKPLDSNEIRQLRDVCIFEVNGIEVYM